MSCRLQTLQLVRPGSSKWLRSWKASGTFSMVKLLPSLLYLLSQPFDLLNPSLPNLPALPSDPGFSLSPNPTFPLLAQESETQNPSGPVCMDDSALEGEHMGGWPEQSPEGNNLCLR